MLRAAGELAHPENIRLEYFPKKIPQRILDWATLRVYKNKQGCSLYLREGTSNLLHAPAACHPG